MFDFKECLQSGPAGRDDPVLLDYASELSNAVTMAMLVDFYS
jgi:hypothetical protein